MAVKILAVDDSPTMRQILELTFAGEDAEVTTVSSGQQAVDAAASLQPDVVLADVSMTGMDGYAVAQAIKANGNAAVILLSSQHNPYDEAKGKASGVDDHVAKPFDSQVVIDKVNQLAANRPKPAPQSRPLSQTAQGPARVPAPTGGPRPKPSSEGARAQSRTMAFGTSRVAPPQPPAAPAPAKRPVLELAEEPEVEVEAPAPPAKPAAAHPPTPAKPAPASPPAPVKPPPAKPTAARPPAPAKPAPAAAAAGAMAQKLDALGLSKEQVEAVLALSREVIEQVVWEVVPDLAETLIQEEIRRLTRE